MTLPLGRRPAKHNLHTMRTALAFAQAVQGLPDPPENSEDWTAAVTKQVGANWGDGGNTRYSNCVACDSLHQRMLWIANTGGTVKPITLMDGLSYYKALVPGFKPNEPDTDTGAYEVDACNLGVKNEELTAWASIDPRNIRNIKWAIAIFGSVKLGVDLPNSAESEFSLGVPWKAINESPVGGHDIPAVSYSGNMISVVTWGGLQQMTTEWWLRYGVEAHVPLAAIWGKGFGTAPSGYDHPTLEAMLVQAVGNG